MPDSIDIWPFLSLKGNPEGPREFVEQLTRAGVDGTAFWLTGFRGRQFTLRSIVDTANLADSLNTFAAYQGLIGAGLVSLVYGGWDMAGLGYQVMVVDVRQVRAAAIIGMVGGICPPSLGILEADWDLVPVSVS
jgi:hypothetical protein